MGRQRWIFGDVQNIAIPKRIGLLTTPLGTTGTTGAQYHLPPTPSLALPVIGHLHLLKQPLHRIPQRFSKKHGPIFSLKLSVRRVVVVSSPDLVEECFTTNDVVFSNCPWALLDDYVGYNRTTIGGAPYGHLWHSLRRLGAQEVFSSTHIDAFSQIRQDEVRRTLQTLIIDENEYTKVGLRPILFELIFNVVTRMLAGKRYSSDEKDNEKLGEKFREIIDEIILLAGTDTSVVTIKWAMSLLLNHPKVLQKAKLELDSQVGHQRLLEEQDLPSLRYLRNIIFETFRMFPAGPLAVPRESSADCKVGGYDIPCGTMLLVNIWAIHRDPQVWDEPTRFKPERFERREVETQMLMTFGMGRRACPGAGLGQRMVGLVLGSLIRCFDWGDRIWRKLIWLKELG
ncbi:hypothetical protein DH2020_016165 [Rehmannia glutinosa]|uniref:Cytochrome P450 protein n=1 Tax=Rehmannia glutinosa TaxID=99300 RepID=A0ABR0WWA3_REHGL